MKIDLKKPSYDELVFRQLLLKDPETMEYNHAYGGTISFTEDRWEKWYKRWILNNSSDFYYRYILDEDINEYVGEVAYHKDEDSGRYICDVIVMAKYRQKGYGKKALLSLLEKAKENGIDVLYDEIAFDNPSVELFLSVGFVVVEKNIDSIIVRIEL